MKKGITITVFFLINTNLFILRAENDTLALISSWTLIKDYSLKKNAEIDTLLQSFQNYNLIFKNSISNSYLGNLGSPSISNVYINRKEKNNFLLINTFNPYMSTLSNTRYFNTRKPFTRLSYTTGGGESVKEETLEAFHTQNINKYFNFGLKYNLISSKGQYKFQRIVNNAFKLFTSYEGRRYNLYANINLNKIKADENGGILNDSLVTDSTFRYTTDIPTLFGGTEQGIKHDPDVLTTIKNLSFLVVQDLDIADRPRTDTLTPGKMKKFVPGITHILKYDKSVRIQRDKKPYAGLNGGLYNETWFNPDYTLDSAYYRQLSNTLRLKLKNTGTKRNINISVDLTHELLKYSFYTPSGNQVKYAGDTSALYRFIGQKYYPDTFNRARPLSNTSASFNVSLAKNDIFKSSLGASCFFNGYKAGSYNINAEFISSPDARQNKSYVILALDYNNETPDFLLQNYYSNYYIWENDFKSTKSTEIDLKYINPLKRAELGLNYSLLNDYIYFDTLALPQQLSGGLSVFSVNLTKFLEFWKFRSLNKLALQIVNKPGYINLPEFMAYNSTYIEHYLNFKLTGGGFLAMLGFDIYYNTKYYADAYNPALGVFHQQNEKKLGNYPYLDVFLNIKLKRTRFFLKYEHLNSGWIYKNYFSVLHYPRNEGMFKAGLSWTFYD
jgi:hypothetical protein